MTKKTAEKFLEGLTFNQKRRRRNSYRSCGCREKSRQGCLSEQENPICLQKYHMNLPKITSRPS